MLSSYEVVVVKGVWHGRRMPGGRRVGASATGRIVNRIGAAEQMPKKRVEREQHLAVDGADGGRELQ
ncbi:hypothetical protein GCM10027093_30610 [Paraburkholderia jirisanensis]